MLLVKKEAARPRRLIIQEDKQIYQSFHDWWHRLPCKIISGFSIQVFSNAARHILGLKARIIPLHTLVKLIGANWVNMAVENEHSGSGVWRVCEQPVVKVCLLFQVATALLVAGNTPTLWTPG